MGPNNKRTLGILFVVILAAAFGFAKFRQAKLQQTENAAAEAQAQKTKTLHLFAMSDYFPPAVLHDFEKKFNARVQYDNFSNNEELIAKFQAGAKGYDVIVPSDYMLHALIAGNYLRELDKAKIPNLANLAKDFVDVPYDPGSKFSVPYTWGTTGLIYNTKLVKENIGSWRQLYDPRYKGRIALLDDLREVFGGMLHLLGFSSNTTQAEQLKAAQGELLKLKPSVRLFSSDPKQHILSGDIWIAQIYSGDAVQVQRQKPELKYVVPKEGATVWIDTLAIPQTAQDAAIAHAFINFILDPQVNQLITKELGYSSPNQAAEGLIPEENLKPSYLRKLGMKSVEFLKDLGPASDNLDQLWTEAKSQ